MTAGERARTDNPGTGARNDARQLEPEAVAQAPELPEESSGAGENPAARCDRNSYEQAIATMRGLSTLLRKVQMRTRTEAMRSVLRKHFRGKKFREARRVIKRQLGWHGRWTAQAHIAMHPWHAEQLAQVWASCAMQRRQLR